MTWVGFVEKACRHRQPRFEGRSVLWRPINLDDLGFRAVIDWIEIQVKRGGRTQVQWVQGDLKTFLPRDSWIDPITPGEPFDVGPIGGGGRWLVCAVMAFHRRFREAILQPVCRRARARAARSGQREFRRVMSTDRHFP
ncbi:hypothetical protein [Rhodobacter ferrooxidans]|uniref:hypothetical protein n=1 Tax=Rhodobacter ferrooxidans TaxID=371731 RepID=UPI0005944E43|nr:hypothetical protein [Rhodobacter sp. SW2]